MKKELKFQSVRFHQSVFILGKTLSGFTPKTEPGIKLRETASGHFEFYMTSPAAPHLARVAWVPASTVESIEYIEDTNETVSKGTNSPTDAA